MKIPDWNDQMLHCVYQNITDGFSGLRRVMDAALILPLIEDHSLLVEEAKEQNLATGLWAVLQLVQELTPTPVPENLMTNLKPSGFVQKCFEVVDLPNSCLRQTALIKAMNCRLTDWLCSPTLKVALHEIWHFLLPRSQDYFYYEHDRGGPPALHKRLKISLSHLISLSGLAFQLAWQLTKHSFLPKKDPQCPSE